MGRDSEEPLLTSIHDAVLTLTLNRPHALNAINAEMRARLRRALAEDAMDPSVRVVLLRGSERAFCVGGDLKEFSAEASTVVRNLEEARDIIESVARMPKPVVTAVQGHAAGAGFSLGLASDILICDETAVFRSAFVEAGFVPDFGGTYWLARSVGIMRAKEIVLTGRAVAAAEGYALGFVTQVSTSATFGAAVSEMVQRLAAGPTLALGTAKRLMNRAFETSLPAALELEIYAQALMPGPSKPA